MGVVMALHCVGGPDLRQRFGRCQDAAVCWQPLKQPLQRRCRERVDKGMAATAAVCALRLGGFVTVSVTYIVR